MTTGRRRLRPGAVVAAAVLAAAWWGGVPRAVELRQDAPLSIAGTDVATVAGLGGEGRGVHAVRYEDHGYVTLRVPVRNDGPVAVTLRSIALDTGELPLLGSVRRDGDTRLPVVLRPGEQRSLSLTLRMDNCEFYTERAMERLAGVDVEVSAWGRRLTEHVRFDRPVVVRSPMMVTCPDRVRDRDANQRRGRLSPG